MLDRNSTLLGIACGVLLGLLLTGPRGGVLVVTVVTAGITLYSLRQRRFLAAMLSGALLARIVLILADTSLGLFPVPPVQSTHHANAVAVVEAAGRGDVLAPWRGGFIHMRSFVAYLYAPFYALFGDWIVVGKLGTALFSLGIGYLTYRLARRYLTEQLALVSCGVVLFWPSVLYRSVLVQREVVVAVCMLAVVLLGIRWTARLSIPEAVAFIAVALALLQLREQNLLLVAVALWTVVLVRERFSTRAISATAAGAVTALAVVAINLREFVLIDMVLPARLEQLTPAAFDRYAHRRAKGTAAYLEWFHIESWLDFLLAIPLKLVYYLLMPFPWTWSSVEVALVGLNALALFVALLIGIRGVSDALSEWPETWVLVTYLTIGLLMYSLVEMNYMAAFRRQIQFVPVVVVLATIRLSSVDGSFGMQVDDRVCDMPMIGRLGSIFR